MNGKKLWTQTLQIINYSHEVNVFNLSRVCSFLHCSNIKAFNQHIGVSNVHYRAGHTLLFVFCLWSSSWLSSSSSSSLSSLVDSEDSRLCSVYRGTGRLARGESREQTAAPYLRRSQAGDYDRDFYMMVIISMLWWWCWWFALIAVIAEVVLVVIKIINLLLLVMLTLLRTMMIIKL